MELYDEFFSIAKGMNSAGVHYAVVGGIAYSFHVQPRFTKDIDFLIAPADLGRVSAILVELGYFESAAPWTFKNSQTTLHRFMKTEGENFLIIDIMLSDADRYRRVLEDAIILDTQQGPIRLASRQDLIWMKSMRGSERDLLDIKDLQNDQI